MMNSKEQAERIYRFCVSSVGTSEEALTYGEVINALGYEMASGQAIRYGLELVRIACGMYGMPDLTAIIVNKATGEPSEAAFPDDSFVQELGRVFSYDSWLDVDEIDWDYLYVNRRLMSERHGTPGYWGIG